MNSNFLHQKQILENGNYIEAIDGKAISEII